MQKYKVTEKMYKKLVQNLAYY